MTILAVNDPNAAISVLSGTGYVTEESSLTISAATTSGDMEFQYWYGDVPYAQRYEPVLTLSGSKPLNVNAFFGKKAANGSVIIATSGARPAAKSWFDAATWTGGVIPGTNDTAVVVYTDKNTTSGNRFKVEAPSFFAVGNLEISNACVRVNSAITPDSCTFEGCVPYAQWTAGIENAVDQVRTEPFGCDIFGNLTIDSSDRSWNYRVNFGSLVVGGRFQSAPTKVTVLGDLTIVNGAIRLYAGYPFSLDWIDPGKAVDGPNGVLPFADQRAFFRGENCLRVEGKTTLKTPTVAFADHRNAISVINEFRTGVAVWCDLADVSVEEKTAFTAYNGGYGKFNELGEATGAKYSMCPGGHCYGDNTSGGSHGGAGGTESSVYPNKAPTTHMATYGFANAPYYPGSANGGNGGIDKLGGGTIRLDCDRLDLEGALLANGKAAGGNKGASAGGSVWVICSQFNPGANCQVEAMGGVATGANSGGGGGRVAICEGLSEEQVEALFSSADHTAPDTVVSELSEKLTTRFSVAGGTGTTQRSDGYDGTGVYIVNNAGKAVLTIAANPENYGAPVPAYGPHVFSLGQEVELSAPDAPYISADNRSKRVCTGYTVTDASGNLLVRSDSIAGTYVIPGDCTLTWDLTSIYHRLDVGATKGGSIVTNTIAEADEEWQPDGFALEFRAVADDGYIFTGWYGELPADLQAGATLNLELTRGRAFKAMFVTSAAGTAEWTGEGDGSSWADPANWDIDAIPGPGSDVVIPAGAVVTADFCLPVSVRNLTVAEGATLTLAPNGAYSTYAKPRILENAAETDWQRISLSVAGDLVVNGTFNIGGKFSLAKFDLSVGGSLVFNEGAKGTFFSAFNAAQRFLDNPTDRYYPADMELAAQYCEGGNVTVGGDFSVATNATVSTWCDFYSGASVRFNVGSLLLAAGGKIEADGKGWGYTYYSDLAYSLCPTVREAGLGGYAGGTHAGIGGYSDQHSPSSYVYGWKYAPFLPGGPGYNTTEAPGGGVVRIHAANALRCYGTISAIGAGGWYCGAGGSVFLTGKILRTGDTTLITAAGRDKSDTGNSGAGGGGRVLVGLKIAGGDLDSLFATGTSSGIASGRISAKEIAEGQALPAGITGTITARGGINNRTGVEGRRYSGEDGTVVILEGPALGSVLILR